MSAFSCIVQLKRHLQALTVHLPYTEDRKRCIATVTLAHYARWAHSDSRALATIRRYHPIRCPMNQTALHLRQIEKKSNKKKHKEGVKLCKVSIVFLGLKLKLQFSLKLETNKDSNDRNYRKQFWGLTEPHLPLLMQVRWPYKILPKIICK